MSGLSSYLLSDAVSALAIAPVDDTDTTCRFPLSLKN